MDITPTIDKLLRGTKDDQKIALEILKSQGFNDFDAITYTYRFILTSLIIDYFEIDKGGVSNNMYNCLDYLGNKTQTFIKIISWK